jgi:hypothetical protein
MREFAEFRVDEAFAPLLFAERRRLVSEVPDVTVALCRMLDALAMLPFVIAIRQRPKPLSLHHI